MARFRAIARDNNTAANPVVIVEVLSPSTQRYDREEKAAHYRRIPSLKSYVLISQEEQRLEVFSRNPDGSWTLREARKGAVELSGDRLLAGRRRRLSQSARRLR